MKLVLLQTWRIDIKNYKEKYKWEVQKKGEGIVKATNIMRLHIFSMIRK